MERLRLSLGHQGLGAEAVEAQLSAEQAHYQACDGARGGEGDAERPRAALSSTGETLGAV